MVPEIKPGDPRYGIFVEAGHALNTRIQEALTTTGSNAQNARQWLCQHYFDIRIFGAVLSTGKASGESKARGAGHIRGPLQVTFARSLHPVLPTDHAITRVTQTRQEDIDKGESTEMGSKWTVPYGLYQAHAFYSASRASHTGVTTEDLDTLWTAITTMFDHDRAATRGEMKLCGLYIFSHPNALGTAPAYQLSSRIQLQLSNPDKPPRQHTDYQRRILHDDLAEGITLTTVADLWP